MSYFYNIILTYECILLFVNAMHVDGCAGETRHAVSSPVQAGQTAGRNDD